MITQEGAADAGVRFAVDGPVARVVLDRPDKRNAQRPELWRALAEFAETVPDDVRVVVVTGNGPSFSAGLDRSMFGNLGAELDGGDDSAFLDTIATYQSGFSWLRRPEFVSVAAVQGHAVGAGFQLALACDIRIAAADAQFTMAEPTLGLVPDLGGTQVLVDLVGYSRALEICATGRRVGADEADRIGLVNLVVANDELTAAVDDLVAGLTSTVHDAVTMTKALLLGARDRPYQQQLLAERQAQLARIKALAPNPGGAGSRHGSDSQP
jgi:enoyl-CoA hydratase/carnithine racemase